MISYLKNICFYWKLFVIFQSLSVLSSSEEEIYKKAKLECCKQFGAESEGSHFHTNSQKLNLEIK